MNSIPNWIERRPHGQRLEISSADLFLYMASVCMCTTDWSASLVMSSEAFLFPVGCVRVQVMRRLGKMWAGRQAMVFLFLLIFF